MLIKLLVNAPFYLKQTNRSNNVSQANYLTHQRKLEWRYFHGSLSIRKYFMVFWLQQHRIRVYSQVAMVNRFGSLKVNIGANIVIIIAHTLYTISQALSHLAPDAMPIVSVVAIGLFLVGLVTTNIAQFINHFYIFDVPPKRTDYVLHLVQ